MLVLIWQTERAARPAGCQQWQVRGVRGRGRGRGRGIESGQHNELLYSDISLQRLAGQQHEESSILSTWG